MIRVAVKYRGTASPEAIAQVELRHGLTALTEIGALRVRGYDVEPATVSALEAEEAVEYVEEERELGLS